MNSTPASLPPIRCRRLRSRFSRLPNGGGLPLPAYASEGAAGMDIVAAETLTRPGTRHAVATGFAMAIPPGYEVQVRPRSGLALKHGVTCLNTPGTIDSDYRGEVKSDPRQSGDEARSGAATASRRSSPPCPARSLRRSRGAGRNGTRGGRIRIDRRGERAGGGDEGDT